MVTYCFTKKVIEELPFSYYQVQKEVFDLFLEKKLTETAFKVYVLLFDRTKVSATNENFKLENGALYVNYSYNTLKAKLNVTDKPIANALNLLEELKLIHRKHRYDMTTDIFVKYIVND